MAKIIPGTKATRMELLSLRKRRELAKKGHDLLKEKRDALIMEFFEMIEDTRRIREDTNKVLDKAYKALAEAKMSMGTLKIEEIAATSQPFIKLEVSTRNAMGVKMPVLKITEFGTKTPSYSLFGTSSKLDEAVNAFKDALKNIIRLAEIESSIRRLATEIEKAKRRVNALNSIVLPRIENTIKYVELHLEEREREDFIRLKFNKKKLERAEEI
ncbi:MAG: V-type ATP synthase subunit D [Candidatus Odinarchaeia archaeon]